MMITISESELRKFSATVHGAIGANEFSSICKMVGCINKNQHGEHRPGQLLFTSFSRTKQHSDDEEAAFHFMAREHDFNLVLFQGEWKRVDFGNGQSAYPEVDFSSLPIPEADDESDQ